MPVGDYGTASYRGARVPVGDYGTASYRGARVPVGDYGTVSNKSCGGARVSVGVHNELPHSMKQKLCGGDWGQV